jgi:hypothetical protein
MWLENLEIIQPMKACRYGWTNTLKHIILPLWNSIKKTMYIKVLWHCFLQAPPLQLSGAGTSMLSEIQTADGDEYFIQVN